MQRRFRQSGSGDGDCIALTHCDGGSIAKWHTHSGQRREKSTRTTDRAAAERILAKAVASEALRREGVIDAAVDRHADNERILIARHVDQWLAAVAAKRVTPAQVKLLRSRVERIINFLGIERLSQLSPSKVQTANTNGGRLRQMNLPR